MKNYLREYTGFSLCGLNCALCPIHHMKNGCPGCGGGNGHQGCAVIRCSLQHGGVEYCFQCPDYPCQTLQEATCFDSFLSHAHMIHDLDKANTLGLKAYHAVLEEKAAMLRVLLSQYNDGRRKSFFCSAINALDLADLNELMIVLRDSTEENAPIKEKSAQAVHFLQSLADKRQISLKLKKRKKECD